GYPAPADGRRSRAARRAPTAGARRRRGRGDGGRGATAGDQPAGDQPAGGVRPCRNAGSPNIGTARHIETATIVTTKPTSGTHQAERSRRIRRMVSHTVTAYPASSTTTEIAPQVRAAAKFENSPSRPSIRSDSLSVRDRSRKPGIEVTTLNRPKNSSVKAATRSMRLAGDAGPTPGAAGCRAGADGAGSTPSGGRPARILCSSGEAYSPYCGRSLLMTPTVPAESWSPP